MESTYSNVYASPEQPVVLTPNRMPTPLPRLVNSAFIFLEACSVTVIMLLFKYKYEYNYSIWRSTMKKLLATLILCAGMGSCAVAHADGWRHGGGHYVYRPNYGWVAPVVIGGIIGYEINRAQQPNVVVVQPQPVYPPPATPYWPQPADYHWEAILDANCGCYRTVLVHN